MVFLKKNSDDSYPNKVTKTENVPKTPILSTFLMITDEFDKNPTPYFSLVLKFSSFYKKEENSVFTLQNEVRVKIAVWSFFWKIQTIIPNILKFQKCMAFSRLMADV